MGGYFSTRWGAEYVRQDTDPLPKLDVRWLKRIGGLQPGAIATPTWTSTRGESSSITTIMKSDGTLALDYRTRRPGQEWQPVRERIALDRTPCNYGGERVWFLCPGCHDRRAVLFSVGGLFRCRACHDLAYTSTREGPTDRALRRCAELRRKLGGSYGQPVWTIPPKPDGMTWRRYGRIVDQLQVEIRRAMGMMDARFEALVRNVDELIAGDDGITP